LGFSDISRSKLIKISEELSDSNSLFFAGLSQSSKDVLNILGLGFRDIIAGDSWLTTSKPLKKVLTLNGEISLTVSMRYSLRRILNKTTRLKLVTAELPLSMDKRLHLTKIELWWLHSKKNSKPLFKEKD
jgi:hypothetical protein